MTAYLKCFESKTAPGDLTLACFAMVDVAKMTKAVPWPEAAAVAFSCSMQVGEEAKRGPTTFIVEGLSRWCINTLSASAASVTALVAPHLEDGQLKGKITFSSMDLQVLQETVQQMLYRLA
jgi:hypothetical protein